MSCSVHCLVRLFFRLSLFAILFILLFPILTQTRKAFASVLFEDNFDSGDTGKWAIPRNDCLPSQWTFTNGRYGIAVSSSNGCVTETVPNDAYWNNNWNDYIIEFDMEFTSGFDKNIAWRYTNPSDWVDLHFMGSSVRFQRAILVNSNNVQEFLNGHTYHFRIEIVGNNFKVFYNDILAPDNIGFMEGVDVANSYPTGKPALQASDHQSEVWFDNFIIQSVGNDLLDVPYYSQNDDRWGQDEYDAAHNWSEEITVDKWGCAVTAAAMVLKYYGIDQDPGTLNTWLKGQADGYIRKGLLNWLAISRYSRKFGPTILEYRRGNNDTAVVDTDLENENPVILETSGENSSHFVVTNGKLDPDYSILDPETEENTSLASFRSSRRLLPTHTNLSTLLIAFDNDLHMEIPAQGGDINQELPHGGGPFWLYQLDQPADGLYELRFRAGNPGWY